MVTTKCDSCYSYEYRDFATKPECMKMSSQKYKQMTNEEKNNCKMYEFWVNPDKEGEIDANSDCYL